MVISQLKEVLNNIILEIEMGDTPAAMREIALFSTLFDQFLKGNKAFIFLQEIQSLNNCMSQMLEYMEQGNLVKLKKVISNSFMCYLDNWDFNNKSIN